MPKMRAAQIVRSGGAFEIVEREIPQPAAGANQGCGLRYLPQRFAGERESLAGPVVSARAGGQGHGRIGCGCVAMADGQVRGGMS